MSASDEMGRFGFDGAEGIAFHIYADESQEEVQARVMFSDLDVLKSFLEHNLPGLFPPDSTPMTEQELNTFAQYLYEEGGTKVEVMTDKAKLVDALGRALSRLDLSRETALWATLNENGSIRVWCPVGVTFPGGTQELDAGGQPTGYAVFWPSTELADATARPAEGKRVASAREFAALWNAKSPQDREDFFVLVLHHQDTSFKCWRDAHEGALEELALLKAQPSLKEIESLLNEWEGFDQGVSHFSRGMHLLQHVIRGGTLEQYGSPVWPGATDVQGDH